jgi:hypothetical protein
MKAPLAMREGEGAVATTLTPALSRIAGVGRRSGAVAYAVGLVLPKH